MALVLWAIVAGTCYDHSSAFALCSHWGKILQLPTQQQSVPPWPAHCIHEGRGDASSFSCHKGAVAEVAQMALLLWVAGAGTSCYNQSRIHPWGREDFSLLDNLSVVYSAYSEMLIHRV